MSPETMTVLHTIAIMAMYGFTYCVVIYYFMHMLQLSSYQFQGYFRFLGSQLRWLPLIFVFVPTACFLLDFTLSGMISAIVYFIIMPLLYWPRKAKIKKKFVITDRVKRLIGTETILWAAVAAVLFAVQSMKASVIVLSLMFALLPLYVALCNLINVPVEQGVRNWYINDAKRMLAEHPDLKIIGITGSFGKTSVKYYLTTLLEEGVPCAEDAGELQHADGRGEDDPRDSLEPTHQIFVCEMGARHVGDIREICDIVHPAVRRDHLDRLPASGDLPYAGEHRQSTKYELFDAVKQNSRGRPDRPKTDPKGGKSLIPERGERRADVHQRGQRDHPAAICAIPNADHLRPFGGQPAITGRSWAYPEERDGFHGHDAGRGDGRIPHEAAGQPQRRRIWSERSPRRIPSAFPLKKLKLAVEPGGRRAAPPAGDPQRAGHRDRRCLQCQPGRCTQASAGERCRMFETLKGAGDARAWWNWANARTRRTRKFGRQAAHGLRLYHSGRREQNTKAIRKGILAGEFSGRDQLFTEETLNGAVTLHVLDGQQQGKSHTA
jgi:hypothetical protein